MIPQGLKDREFNTIPSQFRHRRASYCHFNDTNHITDEEVLIADIRQYSFQKKYYSFLEQKRKETVSFHPYSEAIKALEIYNLDCNKHYKFKGCFATPPLIELMDETERKTHSNWIFASFIAVYLQAYFGESLKDIPDQNACAYMMMFCSDIIVDKLTNISLSSLTKKWLNHLKYNQIKIWSKDNKPLTLSYDEIKRSLSELYGSSKQKLLKKGEQQILYFASLLQKKVTCLTWSKYYYFKGYHEIGMKMYCYLALDTRTLFMTVHCLRILSHLAFEQRAYLISMRILQCCYIFSKGYMSPSFVNHKYRKQRRVTMKKIKSLECAHCRKKNVERKCKPCSGCMKAVYCSKQCQKIHWKMSHKAQCNRMWIAEDFPMYPLLKKWIFDRI